MVIRKKICNFASKNYLSDMKSFAKAIFTFFVCLTAATPALSMSNGPDIFDMLGLTDYGSIAETNFVDTIPITYRNGRVLIPVSIQDSTYMFLYDTGASTCILPESFDYLFEKQLSDKRLRDFDNISTSKMKSGIISEMTIGRLHIKGMKGVLSNKRMPYQCLLGADIFYENGIAAKLDIIKGILVLTDRQGFFDDEFGYTIPVLWGYGYPNVKFSLSYGCSGNALFDTGFNSFMFIAKKYFDKSVKSNTGDMFRKQVINKDYGSFVIGVNGAERSTEKVNMKISEVKIGNMTFQDMPVATSREFTAIGCRILEFGSMIIDPHSRQLIYQPYNICNRVVIDEKQSPFILHRSRETKDERRASPPLSLNISGDTIVVIHPKKYKEQ